ncbi:MAG: hypothetical protein KJ666_08720 [Bacteroidetes bacterium]|nr:hypothetical protein [Bacteroidota bacterium]MBU2586479.1 hypothetical protein [Bacteroidota bacterium]
MKYIKAVTAALLFFLLNQVGVFAQVTVILQQPPPYQFKVEHMWKVTLVNPTRTTFTVSLHGRATETTEGLIVDATSSTFALPPGTKMINPRELVPINIREANPRYRDVVKNIGGVPTGDYEICVSVINSADGLEIGTGCVSVQVQNLTQVELLGPEMGATFSLHGGLDEVWDQPSLIAPVAINKGLRFMISKGSDGSSTAYRMGDPVPGVDINLEQIPGGIKIPVKDWDDYIREVGIKEEGIKFAELRVVTDTDGSTVAYLMGDPVPGVDINLEQIPGGKIPVKGINEYIRDVGIKEEGVMRLRGIEKEQIKRTQGVDVGIKEEGIKRTQGVDVGIKEEVVKRILVALDDLAQAVENHNSSRSNRGSKVMKNAGVPDQMIEEILSQVAVGIKEEPKGPSAINVKLALAKIKDEIMLQISGLNLSSAQMKSVADAVDVYILASVDYNSSRSNVKLIMKNADVPDDKIEEILSLLEGGRTIGAGQLIELLREVGIKVEEVKRTQGVDVGIKEDGISRAPVGIKEEGIKRAQGVDVGIKEEKVRILFIVGKDGDNKAYRMGDPVPGVDINLEQIPGGIKIPVKDWDDYIREVGIKEEGIKFAELRVVTDTDGSTAAYLMGDPVPGVDISLEQIPGGIKIPLKGPDEYRRVGGNQTELAKTKEECKSEGGVWVVNSEGKGFCYKTLRTAVGSYLIFNWLPPTPIPPGMRVTYGLRIVEMLGSQSPYDAMRSNPPSFENRNIISTIYQYPLGARQFSPGRRYAWKVDVFVNNVFISESEIWEFGMAAEEQRRKSGSIIILDRAQMSDQQQGPVKNRPILLASLGLGPELLLLQDRPPGQESSDRSPLQFSGNVRFNTTLASRVASFSEQPRNQWTAELNPVLTFYGLPFTASFLLSSQQEASRQSINNFGFNFDLNRMREDLTSRLEGKIEGLVSSADPEELNRLRDPGNLKDNLDRYGMISGGEKFFMSIRSFGIGTNYPSYSEYTLSGVPVTGVNIEINPGIFYAAFTASANQRGIDNSSYSRSLYAGRIGLGKKEGTHLYFTGLYAKDDEGSIRLDSANNTLTPKANYVFGTEAKLNLFGDILSLQGEGALAVLTRDTRDPELEHKSIPGWVKNLVDPRISTSFDYSYSGKLAFNNDASATMVSLGIKMVGPGYTSLGVPNLRTDQFGYEAKFDQRFFERRVSVGTFFKRYNDNLIKWKRSTTTTTAYGVNLGFTFPRIPFLRLSYSPYSQKNDDLNPLRKVDNTTSVYSVMTGYSYRLGNLNSSTSFTFSGQEAKTVGGIGDYRTNSFMVTEAISLNIPLSFTASWGLIQTTSALGDSRINNIDLGANAQVTDGLSIMGGVNLASEKDRNRRTGFYVSSNISPFQGIGIDIRADRNVYTEEQVALGDYREFIFSATLTARW